MQSTRDTVIVAARRTPIGAFLGALAQVPAPRLAAAPIRALVQDSAVTALRVYELIMGCVLPAGLGQAPARQAALAAGLPESVPCLTLNKMCGSGMAALVVGHDRIQAGALDVVIAGGMESMSGAPHLLVKARGGLAMGETELIDSMVHDGLLDAYNGRLMGEIAEDCAADLKIARERQDQWAVSSFERALEASRSGAFAAEIVTMEDAGGLLIDELPRRGDLTKIPHLPTIFRNNAGTITAANASSLADGAAMMLLMGSDLAARHGCPVMARIAGAATVAVAPVAFPTAPIGAIKTLCARLDWPLESVDLFEINEAFALVTLAAMDALALDGARVNVHGGACALGHPLGASGARILVTLVHAMIKHNKKRGIAALCIGGGEAMAVALERVK